jgi:hypothetical protein
VEGTPEEFKRINKMLRRIPVFKEFELVEDEEDEREDVKP